MEVLISSYIMSSVSISHLGVKSGGGGGWPEQKWPIGTPTFQGRWPINTHTFQGYPEKVFYQGPYI